MKTKEEYAKQYHEAKRALKADYGVSNWLKEAIDHAQLRDPLDAYEDARLFMCLQADRMRAMGIMVDFRAEIV